MFKPNTLSWFWSALWFTVFLVALTAVGFYVGRTTYDNPEVIKSFKDLRETISNVKREKKNKPAKHLKNGDDAPKNNSVEEGMKSALLASVKEKKEKILSDKSEKQLGKKLQGIDFKRILHDGIKEHVAETTASLGEAEKKYNENRSMKWVVTIIFFLIGCTLGYEVPKITNMLSSSKYSRTNLDALMKTLLGEYGFNDIVTQELLVVAYEYNSQEPRFFSKYFAHQDPGIYDIPIGNATGSSSAAPTFFDPHQVNNQYGFTELQIDGGIICNDPSLYAYEMARDLYGYRKIRMLSLGTGEEPFTKVDPKTFDVASALAMNGEFIFNMDTYAADSYLRTNIPGGEKNYVRAQVTSSLSMDAIAPKDIQNLKDAGTDMWNKNEVKIKAFIRTIIDERYHVASTPAKK